MKLVDNGGVGWIFTVWELVTVWADKDESIAVSVTVKGWALEYVCDRGPGSSCAIAKVPGGCVR